MLPVLVSLFPIGGIIAIAGVDIGLTVPQVLWMSVGIYNGLAQAAVIELIDSGGAPFVIVLAGVLINMRFLMYSASIAPYFGRVSRNERLSLAYLSVDTVYALAVVTFERDGTDNRVAYYLGAGVASWIAWQGGTVFGLLAEDFIPEGLDLQFAIPLLFIALIVPVLDSRPSLGAGATAGGIAVLAAGLPFNLGLIVGTTVGIAVGVFGDGRWDA